MINNPVDIVKASNEFNVQKQPMIDLRNINKVYRTDTVETLAVNDISLSIKKGEFLSVMGDSYTLPILLALFEKPTRAVSVALSPLSPFALATSRFASIILRTNAIASDLFS